MRLYHYTAFLYLPEILRDGITRGEVPINPHTRTLADNAANLTTSRDALAQQKTWAEGILDKTKIRIIVEIQESELMTFGQLKKKYSLSKEWLNRIDPHKEGKHWYYAFGGVKRSQFVRVEIRSENRYKPIKDAELTDLVQKIELEIERALIIDPKTNSTLVNDFVLRFKLGVCESWLVDGTES